MWQAEDVDKVVEWVRWWQQGTNNFARDFQRLVSTILDAETVSGAAEEFEVLCWCCACGS